jgi:hypothetical protein
MTRDDIIRMAHEADCLDDQHYGTVWANKLERFAQLVAAHEHEACAKECETLLPSQSIFDQRYYEAVEDCVATIRERSEV